MYKKLQFILSLAAGFVMIFSAHAQTVSSQLAATDQSSLQAQIDAKTADLDRINKQLEESQQNLSTTKSQRLTLQKQMANLVNNINALELSIKSDAVTNEKLGLELNSLSYDIRDTQLS